VASEDMREAVQDSVGTSKDLSEASQRPGHTNTLGSFELTEATLLESTPVAPSQVSLPSSAEMDPATGSKETDTEEDGKLLDDLIYVVYPDQVLRTTERPPTSTVASSSEIPAVPHSTSTMAPQAIIHESESQSTSEVLKALPIVVESRRSKGSFLFSAADQPDRDLQLTVNELYRSVPRPSSNLSNRQLTTASTMAKSGSAAETERFDTTTLKTLVEEIYNPLVEIDDQLILEVYTEAASEVATEIPEKERIPSHKNSSIEELTVTEETTAEAVRGEESTTAAIAQKITSVSASLSTEPYKETVSGTVFQKTTAERGGNQEATAASVLDQTTTGAFGNKNTSTTSISGTSITAGDVQENSPTFLQKQSTTSTTESTSESPETTEAGVRQETTVASSPEETTTFNLPQVAIENQETTSKLELPQGPPVIQKERTEEDLTESTTSGTGSESTRTDGKGVDFVELYEEDLPQSLLPPGYHKQPQGAGGSLLNSLPIVEDKLDASLLPEGYVLEAGRERLQPASRSTLAKLKSKYKSTYEAETGPHSSDKGKFCLKK
jgi:hypothetical protein